MPSHLYACPLISAHALFLRQSAFFATLSTRYHLSCFPYSHPVSLSLGAVFPHGPDDLALICRLLPLLDKKDALVNHLRNMHSEADRMVRGEGG